VSSIQERATGRIPLTAILAVGASAGLLFAMEPFAAKVLLPRMGGTPSVWNTCVMVFQMLLLAGYGYSVLLVRIADVRKSVAVHAALVVVSIAVWPFAVQVLWLTPPAGWPPVAWVTAAVVAAIGLPFAILSATSPLLQVWLARASPEPLHVHRLYSASNVASVVGLVAYVAVLEPLVGVRRQSVVLWLGYAGAMIVALIVARASARATLSSRADGASGPPAPDPDPLDPPERAAATGFQRAWIVISFGASLCLYAVNTYIATDVASFPLLWCLPLGVFLAGFAIGFSPAAAPWRVWLARLAKLAALAAVAQVVWVEDSRTVWVGLLAPLIALACLITALAAELAHRRPPEDRLAGYYAWIGLGGVIAGVASVIVLPWAWSSFSGAGLPVASNLTQVLRSLSSVLLTQAVPEYVVALLLSIALLSNRRSANSSWQLAMSVSVATLVAVVGTRLLSQEWWLQERLILVGTALACALIASSHGTRLLAAGLTLAIVGGLVQRPDNELLFEARNFFGTSRVLREGNVNELKHGTTLHGIQPSNEDPTRPASYYSWSSPLGRVIDRLHPQHVLSVGLGVGTVAAYGHAGDRYRFLEINPLVERIATNPQWFTYVAAARSRGVVLDIAIGDGRLLAQSLTDGDWDLIVVDAFSSDAIPVHLLSVEAVQLLGQKLSPRGILAYHVSNRFFDLQPVVAAAATRVGMTWAYQDLEGLTSIDYGSKWVMLARSESAARDAGLTDVGWLHPESTSAPAPWTDDWANVLGTMRTWKFWKKDES
jgi:SAM-dependent methyltransferase